MKQQCQTPSLKNKNLSKQNIDKLKLFEAIGFCLDTSSQKFFVPVYKQSLLSEAGHQKLNRETDICILQHSTHLMHLRREKI